MPAIMLTHVALIMFDFPPLFVRHAIDVAARHTMPRIQSACQDTLLPLCAMFAAAMARYAPLRYSVYFTLIFAIRHGYIYDALTRLLRRRARY